MLHEFGKGNAHDSDCKMLSWASAWSATEGHVRTILLDDLVQQSRPMWVELLGLVPYYRIHVHSMDANTNHLTFGNIVAIELGIDHRLPLHQCSWRKESKSFTDPCLNIFELRHVL